MIHTNKCCQSSKMYFHRDMYFIWQRLHYVHFLNYVHFPVEVYLNGHNLKMMGHGIHTQVCLIPNLFIPFFAVEFSIETVFCLGEMVVDDQFSVLSRLYPRGRRTCRVLGEGQAEGYTGVKLQRNQELKMRL